MVLALDAAHGRGQYRAGSDFPVPDPSPDKDQELPGHVPAAVGRALLQELPAASQGLKMDRS